MNDSKESIDASFRAMLKHDSRSFGAIRALNVIRHAFDRAGLLSDEASLLFSLIAKETDKKEFFTDGYEFPLDAFLSPTVYCCPRCKWEGKEADLKQITTDDLNGKAIDYADGSPIMGCPKCGEHCLNEIPQKSKTERARDWFKTGKLDGKKITNIFAVAHRLGMSVDELRKV